MAGEDGRKRKRRAAAIARELALAYPDAHCALHFENPFQLLIATILAAQCTDHMVNQVTAELFPKYGSPEALCAAPEEEIQSLIRRTGFFRQKTKSIQSASRDLVEKFGGEVPRTMEELVQLRGVARKTANVVLGNCFDTPGLPIDTHMKRVHQRLGLTDQDDPVKIERDLMALIPQEEWTQYAHRVISHGREVCLARKPSCQACALAKLCPHGSEGVPA